MRIASSFIPTSFGIFLFSVSTVVAVTRQECKTKYLPPLLECIDSFEGKGTPSCDLLPIPDFAMPQNQANEQGYWIQTLRNTPTSHVFAVSENAYNSLIVVDVPAAKAARGIKLNLNQKGNLRKLQGVGAAGPVEESEDADGIAVKDADGITVAFIDFPPTFIHPDGNGSHLISALGDILDTLEATTDDIAKFELIYTHGHMDHIGLANHTFKYITETLGTVFFAARLQRQCRRS